MKRRYLAPWLVLAAFLLACSCLPMTSLGRGATATPESPAVQSNPSSPGQTAAGYDSASALAGHWTGTWNNTTFATTGGIDLTIDVRTDGTALLTLNLTGNVLGGSTPPQISVPGVYNDAALLFTGTGLEVFGTLQVTISPGSFSMDAAGLPVAGILLVTAEGTVADDRIDIDYVVGIIGGSANGTATLTRTP